MYLKTIWIFIPLMAPLWWMDHSSICVVDHIYDVPVLSSVLKCHYLMLLKNSLDHAVPAWRVEVQNFSFKNLDSNHFKALTWCKTVFCKARHYTIELHCKYYFKGRLGTFGHLHRFIFDKVKVFWDCDIIWE